MLGFGSLWSWLLGKLGIGDGRNMENKAVESFIDSAGLPSEPTIPNSTSSASTVDGNGINQLQVDASSPIASASNIISYDPNKSALDNMYGYAIDNNSASAYSAFLDNKFSSEMANSAISRAIADAEANGISKYQLFQSGNMAAATPSSAGSSWRSYENAMNRKEDWNEKELAALVAIVTSTMSAAAKIFG